METEQLDAIPLEDPEPTPPVNPVNPVNLVNLEPVYYRRGRIILTHAAFHFNGKYRWDAEYNKLILGLDRNPSYKGEYLFQPECVIDVSLGTKFDFEEIRPDPDHNDLVHVSVKCYGIPDNDAGVNKIFLTHGPRRNQPEYTFRPTPASTEPQTYYRTYRVISDNRSKIFTGQYQYQPNLPGTRIITFLKENNPMYISPPSICGTCNSSAKMATLTLNDIVELDIHKIEFQPEFRDSVLVTVKCVGNPDTDINAQYTELIFA